MRWTHGLQWTALFLMIGCCGRVAQALDHPLEPLSRAELQLAFRALRAHFEADPQLPKEALLVPLLALKEPEKAALRSWSKANPLRSREAEAEILHWPSNRSWIATVELAASPARVTSLLATPAGSQPGLSTEEYEAAVELVRKHEPWQRAVRARGADPAHAYVDVWAPGEVTLSDAQAAALSHGRETRLVRCLTFAGRPGAAKSPRQPDNPYARPLDGMIALVDLNARRVVQMSDVPPQQAVSSETGNARLRAARLKPLKTQAARGSNVGISGQLVRFQGWQFYVAMHPREGAVFYDLRHQVGDELRSVAHRLSLSEIYVPYGFGDAEWSWRSAFDVGEYNAGAFAQTLDVDRDVPENAHFLGATFAGSRGLEPNNPNDTRDVPRALALYERDAGVLWSRTDPNSGARDTRFARELVATWSTWIGNYVYGFEWIFKQDGSLEVRVQLTGTTLNRAATAQLEPGAPKVGKDARGVLVAAPNHQHFFSFRLDLDVDGPENHVMESELKRLPGTQNAFDKVKTTLTREGPRDADLLLQRKWCVMSNSARNILGVPTAFTLEPASTITPLSAADFPGLRRAGFAKHALWVTHHAEGELFAAGRFPGQSSGKDGLEHYIAPAQALSPERGDDVVLWYTLGLTHVPRLEDYPVMSTESIGFRLVPHGFFDRNPALDVADQGR